MDEAEAEQDALQTRVRDEAQCDALSLPRLVRALHRSGNIRESFCHGGPHVPAGLLLLEPPR